LQQECSIPQQQEPRILSAIGTWQLFPSGITWNLPALEELTGGSNAECTKDSSSSPPPPPRLDNASLYYYQFHANFHPNPFGPKPKMVRGIITQCRRRRHGHHDRWALRPVVGTFVGKGVGEDLYDVSYSKRGLGLPKQPLVTPTTTTTTTTTPDS